jgi:thiaminase
MSISSRLWLRCFDTALASATSPFVISLTRGILPKPTFKAFIAQDAFYLGSFKKAFADAATICEKDSDVFGVDHFETMGNLIDTELKMHAKFALELNIDLTTVSPLPQTLLYTDFLGAAGTSNYVSHICAAMTPCMTLYGFLGRRAKIGSTGRNGNPYQKWIEEYSSIEFNASAERMEMLLDHYAAKDGQNYDDLLKLYAKAMELEYNFFSAHETASWTGITPRFLGIDFDDTISAGDTISTLCKGGLKAQGVTDEKVYSDLLVNYVAKYEEFMASNLIEQTENSDVIEHRKVEFENFMHTYSTFEDSMLTPVENSLILQGLSSGSLDTLAEGVKMKANAIDTLKYAMKSYPGVELHVLSVNWSKKFLGSMLNIHMPNSRVTIHANELQGLHGETHTADSVSSGAIERNLTGPKQKADLLKSLLSVEKSNGNPSAYIGDSLGDLSALLEADIGIIIGTSSSLRKVCSIYGIALESLDNVILNQRQPVQDQGAVDSKGSGKNPTLYVAESWAHIGFCLFGNQYVSNWLSTWTRGISKSPTTRDPSPSALPASSALPTVLCIAGSDSGVNY